MPATVTENPTVVRNERGLTVKGTRLTLYHIMDYVRAGCSREELLEWFPQITAAELADILDYIETNRAEFEAEYEAVVKRDEEIRQYWEERNREHREQIAKLPPPPGKEALHAKLQEWKAKLGLQ